MLSIKNKYQRKVLNLWLKFLPLSYKSVRLGKGSSLSPKLLINDGSRVNGKIVFKGTGQIELGRHCALGDGIKFISSNHSINTLNLQFDLNRKICGKSIEGAKRGITIGHNVWIGDNVIILPGVKVGNGAIIGAGSVVTKNIAAYTLAAGNPVRIIKSRFDTETIELIEKLNWWEWSIGKMKNNSKLFIAETEHLKTLLKELASN